MSPLQVDLGVTGKFGNHLQTLFCNKKSHLDPQRHVDFSWSEPWNNAGWRREEQGLFLSSVWNNAGLSSHLCVPAPSLQLPFFALSVLDPTWCKQRLLCGLPLSLCTGFPFLATIVRETNSTSHAVRRFHPLWIQLQVFCLTKKEICHLPSAPSAAGGCAKFSEGEGATLQSSLLQLKVSLAHEEMTSKGLSLSQEGLHGVCPLLPCTHCPETWEEAPNPHGADVWVRKAGFWPWIFTISALLTLWFKQILFPNQVMY